MAIYAFHAAQLLEHCTRRCLRPARIHKGVTLPLAPAIDNDSAPLNSRLYRDEPLPAVGDNQSVRLRPTVPQHHGHKAIHAQPYPIRHHNGCAAPIFHPKGISAAHYKPLPFQC